MKKLVPTTSLNDAIRRIAAGDTGAASVIAMLNRERPENVMSYLQALDSLEIYGHDIYDVYWNECYGILNKFVERLSVK